MEIKKMKLFKLETYNKKLKLKNILKNFDNNQNILINKNKKKKGLTITLFIEKKEEFLNYAKQHNLKTEIFHETEIIIIDCLL